MKHYLSGCIRVLHNHVILSDIIYYITAIAAVVSSQTLAVKQPSALQIYNYICITTDIKMITIFVLLLLVSQYSATIAEQTISVFSKHYQKEFEIKTSPQRLCDSMDILKLEGMDLDFLHDNLIQSDTLRHISLRNNCLTNIPIGILDHVKKLTCLDLSKNKINLNSNIFIMHDFLRVLDLRNQIPIFTDGKCKTKVEHLKDNGKNELKIFNTTSMYLPNLEHIFLSDNDIMSSDIIPGTFSKSFPKLSHIYLNNINIGNINTDFFNKVPKTLRVLYLENNKLAYLKLQNITDITELYLGKNPLRNIEIVSKKLEILSLSHGAAMGHIELYTPNLEYLDLSHNNFYVVSNIYYKDFYLLKTLLLDYNEFSTFPLFDINLSLTKLSLSYNKLSYIGSKHFKHLTSLKILSLRGNRIRNIEDDAFNDLNHLKILDLSQNELKNLPNNWVLKLSNLQFLNTSSNNFERISDMEISSFSSLTHLFVEDNPFTSITTTELSSLPKLIIVYLD